MSARQLLNASSTTGLIEDVAEYIQKVRACVRANQNSLVMQATELGVKFYIAEGGIVGPAPGFKPNPMPYAAALWGIDALLEAASHGALRWNFHGGPQCYSMNAPICYENLDQDIPTATALYYATWVFAEATKRNSRVVDLNSSSPTPHVSLWGLRDEQNEERVVAVHKGWENPQPVHLCIKQSLQMPTAASAKFLVLKLENRTNPDPLLERFNHSIQARTCNTVLGTAWPLVGSTSTARAMGFPSVNDRLRQHLMIQLVTAGRSS